MVANGRVRLPFTTPYFISTPDFLLLINSIFFLPPSPHRRHVCRGSKGCVSCMNNFFATPLLLLYVWICTYVVFCVGKGCDRYVAIATIISSGTIIVVMNVSGLFKNQLAQRLRNADRRLLSVRRFDVRSDVRI